MEDSSRRLIFPDFLRFPTELDTSQAAYKDWLHLNVINVGSGSSKSHLSSTQCITGIFNASLHGSPRDPRSIALGTALVHRTDLGWVGNVEVMPLEQANLQPGFVGLEHLGIATVVAPAGIRLSVDEIEGVSAEITATALEPPIMIELPLPFGKGWIAWAVAPRLRPFGHVRVGDDQLQLDSTSHVYHDHNWGRWYWGDDIGWEWGYFQAQTITVVFARTTNRAHTQLGSTWLSIHGKDLTRLWTASLVSCDYSGRFEGRLRRLPGAMAALHQDRARPWLPNQLVIRAVDGRDQLELCFEAGAAAQLIAADPVTGGYSFVHELPGTFTIAGRLNGKEIQEQGHAIFEYVD